MDKICGRTKEEIRKAFFTGKLTKLLDDIKSENEKISEAELSKLEKFLDKLNDEKIENQKVANRYNGNIETPDADTLLRMTPEQNQKLKEWIASCKSTMDTIKEIMAGARTAVMAHNNIKRNDWLDYGLKVITLMFSVDQYEIVHEQLYRAELTRIIDTFAVSRAEAEERARLTPEYREYKIAQRLKENILEFEMMAKKYAGVE